MLCTCWPAAIPCRWTWPGSNERIFLNNSSIGLYARMVEIRRRYEARLGKWRALVHAARLVVRHAGATELRFGDGETLESVRTYLLFVGNNQYELDLLHLGQRGCLDAGELCCFILEAPGRLALMPHVFHYLRGHRPYERVFRSLCTHELTVIPGRARRAGLTYSASIQPKRTIGVASLAAYTQRQSRPRPALSSRGRLTACVAKTAVQRD